MRAIAISLTTLSILVVSACGSDLSDRSRESQAAALLAQRQQEWDQKLAEAKAAKEAADATTPSATVAAPAPSSRPEEDPPIVLDDAAYARSATLPLFDHMPTSCESARAVIRLGKIIQGSIATDLDVFAQRISSEKGPKVAAALRSSGWSWRWVQDVALCVRKSDSQTLFAASLDAPTGKQPVDAVAQLLASLRREPPTREDHGPVALFMPKGPTHGGVVAVVGRAALLVSDKRPTVEQALVGAPDKSFAESAGKVIWVRSFADEPFELDVVEAGDGYDGRFSLKLDSSQAEEKAARFKAYLRDELPKDEKKLPPLKTLDAVLRSAKVEAQGSSLMVNVHIPKTTLSTFIHTLQNMKVDDMAKLFM